MAETVSYRKHAEELSASTLNLIKQILIKHDATILEELHVQVRENAEAKAALESEIVALQKHIIKLEGWQELPTIEWAGLELEHSILVIRVLDECDALRRGIGISYSNSDDPVLKLRREMPSIEQINAVEKARLLSKQMIEKKP